MSAAPLWTPTAESIADSNLGRFIAWLDRRGIGTFASYDELWRWSVSDIAGFWTAIAEYFEISTSVPYTAIMDRPVMPGARWLVDARLNYAEHILRHQIDGTAIIAHSQTRRPSSLSWADLADQVGRARAGLKRLGAARGGRVVASLPNVPETIAAFLATASLGAIW